MRDSRRRQCPRISAASAVSSSSVCSVPIRPPLFAMSGVRIATLDRLISGDRHDPVLIIGKKMGLEWATVRALLLLRLGPDRAPPPADIESWRANFLRLMPSTAERIVKFWNNLQTF